ncbi:hypothetical protein [Caballeronia sp. TF1N1]|uniref:hypothetical protein n=1 Tax=Caballeronia sp. TF1N1 TaxID=2878153 RepID=UPI001FCFE91B|nr:hypothetical protein [Caballeronia sp. TF1N1]
MKTKHTPGPWNPSVETGFVYSVHHCLIAEVYSGDGHGQQSANARLIAAAPELLEVLIAINDYVSNPIAFSGSADKGEERE